MSAPSRPTCVRHPPAAAGWTCNDCHATPCPRCAADKPVGPTRFTVCCVCGGAAQLLQVPRRALPCRVRLRSAWRWASGECVSGVCR